MDPKLVGEYDEVLTDMDFEAEKDNIRYAGITVFSTEDIKERGVKAIMDDAFKIAGYKRTLPSMRREWETHNFLYNLGIFKSRTENTDLDNNESFIRKTGYAVLSFIYTLFNRRKKAKND